MTGLYVHIPFCVKKCHYCNFVITGAGSQPKEEWFLELFEKEAAYYQKFFQKTRFRTLYLGGGTPSALELPDMEKILSALHRNFFFQKDIEITCEVNPGDVSAAKARGLKKLGINRVSLGAQTFHGRTLKKLNRAHDARDISKSFRILRDAGFKNISMDLMLSLPGESLDDVKVSLEKMTSLGPEHVSLYELVVEEKTVFGRRQEKGTLILPPEKTQVEMLSCAREYLQSKGFKHYELLSYAKPGFESRHNLLYWANEEYLGLGPGAFSYFGGRRFRNSSSFDEYMKKMAVEDWSAFEDETLDAEARLVESFLLALRKMEGADVKIFKEILKKMKKNVEDLSEKGLIEIKNGKIRLTKHGQFFAETVFSEFSSPL